MTDAPRDNLSRSVDFTVVRATDDDDGLTLEGYGAVFNTPTRIDSMFEGRFDEIIAPGAFAKTIKDKGARGIRLQFDHGAHPLIGSIPLGTITDIHEDGRGLYVSARLSDNWLVQPIRDAIRDGAVDGMSFRFRVVRDEWDETDPDLPVRTLREVELFEVGPVVWPAYDATTVGVRAREIARDMATDEDFRAELLRALAAVGTSDDAAPARGTSTEAAPNADAPPEQGTRRTQAERRQAYRRLCNPITKEHAHEAA